MIFGCDPECFVIHQGKVVPGTILFPNHVKLGNYGYVCHDGVQVEFNPYPQKSYSDLVAVLSYMIEMAMSEITQRVGEADIVFTAVQEVPIDIIKEAGEADRSALEFGCSPDINVWNARDTSFRGDASELPLRFGGGHLHLTVPGNRSRKMEFVRALERTVGLVINSNSPEQEAARRQWYGKAGACRIKDYGIEWRTPSSAIFNSLVDSKVDYKLESFLKLVQLVLSDKLKKKFVDDEEVCRIINEGEVITKVWEEVL